MPWLLTCAIVIGALVVAFGAPSIQWAASAGDYVAGFAGALAFVWLVAGYHQQRKELSIQRRELMLQRRTLRLQSAELAKAARHGALGQIEAMLRSFSASIPHRGILVSGIDDFPTAYIQGMALWKPILDGTSDEGVVVNSYLQWLRLDDVATSFLNIFTSAAGLYADATGRPTLIQVPDSAAFVVVATIYSVRPSSKEMRDMSPHSVINP